MDGEVVVLRQSDLVRGDRQLLKCAESKYSSISRSVVRSSSRLRFAVAA
jgi:hypothetical protein